MTTVVVRPTHNRSELRQAILRVSARIGSEDGQAALTMRNIAAAIGVSPTILYQHFDSKAAILRELESHAHAELASCLDAACAANLPPDRRLRGLCHAYLEFAAANPWLYSLLFSEGPAGARHRADPFTPRAVSCLRAVEALRARLEPTIAGLHVWAAMHGLALAVRDRPSVGPVDARTFVEGYVSTVLAGLGL